jgi:hypothetical protein
MKTRTHLNLNVLILNLYYCNYIYTALQEKTNLQHSVYCPSGVLGADSLGADTSSISSSGRSAISDVEVVGVVRFSLEILAAFSYALLKSARISACVKQVCFFLISTF